MWTTANGSINAWNNFNINCATAFGCLDPLACNYDSIASYSDSSCVYPTTSTSNATSCDSYLWNGNVYTSSGTYLYLSSIAAGCDSTAILNLTINNSYTTTDTQIHCDSYTWVDGVTYTTSNTTATHMFQTVDGCDSLSTLDLTIHYSDASIDTQVHCDSYTWVDGVTYTTSNTNKKHKIQTIDKYEI